MAEVDHGAAVSTYATASDLDPLLWVGPYELAWTYPGIGDFEAAIEAATAHSSSPRRRWPPSGGSGPCASLFTPALENENEPSGCSENSEITRRPLFVAFAHAALGDLDGAFDMWRDARWTASIALHFRYSPLLDHIRTDSRYAEVLREIDRQWGW